VQKIAGAVLLAEFDGGDADLNELDECGSDDLDVFANLDRQIVHVTNDAGEPKLTLKFAQTGRPVFEVTLKRYHRRVHGLVAEFGELVQAAGDWIWRQLRQAKRARRTYNGWCPALGLRFPPEATPSRSRLPPGVTMRH